MIAWIQTHETVLWWLAAASAVTFVVTLMAVPWLIVRIPSDYFAHRNRKPHATPWTDRHPAVRGMLFAGKNGLGCIFVVAGIVMLVLPGQGILTILVGIMLLSLPGKYRLERWLVGRPRVLRSVNWLRRRAGKTPLVLDP